MFFIQNNCKRTFSVLTWAIPLRGLQSSCLTPTRDGKELDYEGVFLMQEELGLEHFVLIGAGQIVP